MGHADNLQALFAEALCDLDRQLKQEMERVGRMLLRWLADLWPRMPCDTWRGEFDRIVADLAGEQLFVEAQSCRDFIAWLGEVNASAAVARAEGHDGSPAATHVYIIERLEPPPLRHDTPAPFDSDYSELRLAGYFIFKEYPPTTWHERAVEELLVHRVPQEIASAFLHWIANEQQKAFEHAVDSLPSRLRKALAELFAEIDRMPPQDRLEEVRKLLLEVHLPPELEAWILLYYTAAHKTWMEKWAIFHHLGPYQPAPARPETQAELLLRVAAGLDKLVAEGRLDELVGALRELTRRLPEFVPGSGPGGPFEELSRELQSLLGLFVDLLQALPPEAGEVAIELLQVALGILGLIPGAGEVFDFISALISGRRGEWFDVLLSAVALIPLAGIATGIAKILKRLKKLGTLIAKLKGPARTILLHFVGALTVALKEIPINSIHAATAGLKRFVIKLRELLEQTIAKLKKLKSTAPSKPTPTPKGPAANPKVANGNLFNRLRKKAYPYREVHVVTADGTRYILDGYNPALGEIVSRKGTQLAGIGDKSAIGYIREAARKYAPGTKIAKVPTSGALAGTRLQGKVFLEVPVQTKSISDAVLNAATRFKVTIRDVNGKIYNP